MFQVVANEEDLREVSGHEQTLRVKRYVSKHELGRLQICDSEIGYIHVQS